VRAPFVNTEGGGRTGADGLVIVIVGVGVAAGAGAGAGAGVGVAVGVTATVTMGFCSITGMYDVPVTEAPGAVAVATFAIRA